jgi:formylglycine-generating enzyme required for sulfatase activity
VFGFKLFASALATATTQTPGSVVSSVTAIHTVAVISPSTTAPSMTAPWTATTAATLTTLPTSLPTLTLTIPATATPTQSATFTSVPTAMPVKTSDPTLCTTIGQKLTSPVDGMIQVCVPAGKFLMGATESDKLASPEERPQHAVTLDAFWIDQTEVTNAMYQQCVRAEKCAPPFEAKSRTRLSYYGSAQFANYPVIYVKWTDADSYCRWAGRRLPSEAEWEKAARGMEGWPYPWGNAEPSEKVLNYNQFIKDTMEVGKYPNASPYGALDMAGNAFEWVGDWYGEGYYVSSPAINPTGPTGGTLKVLRGGSWFNNAADVRSSFRAREYPGGRDDQSGFRCAR